MPAILSALLSAGFAYFATADAYGDSLYSIFPGMKNSTLLEENSHEMIIGVSSWRVGNPTESQHLDVYFLCLIFDAREFSSFSGEIFNVVHS